MNSPILWFIVVFCAFWLPFAWLARKTIEQIASHAAFHAKQYAAAYAKGGALMAIAAMTSYDETFSKLSTDVAEVLPWWHWLALYFKPVVAMLAVLVAFLDGTVQRSGDKRDAAAKTEKENP